MSHPFLADIVWEDVQAKRMPPPFVPQIQGIEDVSHFDTNWTSDVTEVGKVIDASLFDLPVRGHGGGDGSGLDTEDELHINNFEYTSPDLSCTHIRSSCCGDEETFVIE